MANKTPHFRLLHEDRFQRHVRRVRGETSLRVYAASMEKSVQYVLAVEVGRRPASIDYAANYPINKLIPVPVTAYELVPVKEWVKRFPELAKERFPAQASKPKPKPKPKPRAKRKPRPQPPKVDKRQMVMTIPLEPMTDEQKRKNRNGHKRSESERLTLIAKAKHLREENMSFGNIAKTIGVPKASIIGWLQEKAS